MRKFLRKAFEYIFIYPFLIFFVKIFNPIDSFVFDAMVGTSHLLEKISYNIDPKSWREENDKAPDAISLYKELGIPPLTEENLKKWEKSQNE